MGKIRIIILAILSLIFIQVKADDDAVKKQINSIKKSNLYIYGEHTAATEQEATEIAEEILNANINSWAAQKKRLRGSNNFIVNNKKSFQSTLSVSRGQLIRVFVYVKKSDITASDNSKIVNNTQTGIRSTVEHINPTKTYPEVVMTIASFSDYKPMADKIMQLKEQGKIVHYGRYTSLEKPELYYLAIYNTAGKVMAVLSPGATRYNVKTGESDQITNYSGCGAIGFIPSK